MQAFASGVALDGQPCVPLTEAARLEPFDVSRFACEHCKRKLCPSCGALMTKERGAVSEEVIATGVNVKKRVARPATFYACGACEHCEEV